MAKESEQDKTLQDEVEKKDLRNKEEDGKDEEQFWAQETCAAWLGQPRVSDVGRSFLVARQARTNRCLVWTVWPCWCLA